MVSKDNKKKTKNTMSDTDCQLDFEYLAEYSINNDNYAIQVVSNIKNQTGGQEPCLKKTDNPNKIEKLIKTHKLNKTNNPDIIDKPDKTNIKDINEKDINKKDINKKDIIGKDTNEINLKEKTPKENKLLQKSKDQYQIMSRYEQQEWQCGNSMVAGLDEVGRGPLAGPVVAAACILDPGDPILGLNDSKKLSEKKRNELFVEIQNRAICYSIVRIEHDVIDEINILNATKMAMVECVRILVQKPDKLLIDAINLQGTGIPVIPIIKGDSLSVSIAAASILAKVTRDRLMVEYDETYPGYGFSQNKGYGTALHYEGIKKQGITPIHRKTFLKGWI